MTKSTVNIYTTAPKGSQALIDGSFYKIGLHNKPFRHDGREWVRANREAREVLTEINLQFHRFNRVNRRLDQ